MQMQTQTRSLAAALKWFNRERMASKQAGKGKAKSRKQIKRQRERETTARKLQLFWHYDLAKSWWQGCFDYIQSMQGANEWVYVKQVDLAIKRTQVTGTGKESLRTCGGWMESGRRQKEWPKMMREGHFMLQECLVFSFFLKERAQHFGE